MAATSRVSDRTTRRIRARLAPLFLGALLVGAAVRSQAGEDPQAPDLRGGKIRDVATKVSVPLSDTQSLVFALHEGFWVQCPLRQIAPTSLSGDGLILQFLNARGGSVSLGYVGSDPLLPALDGETAAARVERSVRGFVDGLGQRYERVAWKLTPGKIAIQTANLRMGGKKTPVWRTARYGLAPAGEYGGPRSTFVGECVLFQPEGTDRLAYAVLDAKAGGTTLDKMLQAMSIQATHLVSPAGRVVQVNDLFEGEGGRFPVRLVSYESPAGFVLGPGALGLPGEWVYAEDRLAAQGKVTGWHRIQQRAAEKGGTILAEAQRLRTSFGESATGPLKEVALATPGARAHVFRLLTGLPEGASGAVTAVIRLDDLTLLFTWTTFGDAALTEKDAVAFERLLGTMQLAVRW